MLRQTVQSPKSIEYLSSFDAEWERISDQSGPFKPHRMIRIGFRPQPTIPIGELHRKPDRDIVARAKRVPADLPALVVSAEGRRALHGSAVDLSTSGVLIHLPPGPPLQGRSNIKISLALPNCILHARARRVRDSGGGHAFAFVKLGRREQNAVQTYVNRLSKRGATQKS